MSTATEPVEELAKQEYKYGFVTDVETDSIPVGLSEDVVRLISAKKEEPDWLLEWRLNAFRVWTTMAEPNWHNVEYTPIDYQAISYYAAPKKKTTLQRLDEAGGVPAIDHPVIATDRDVHQLALLQPFAAQPVGHEHRPFHDPVGPDDRDLGPVDARRRYATVTRARAPPDRFPLDDRYARAAFRQYPGRVEAGVAAPDDGDLVVHAGGGGSRQCPASVTLDPTSQTFSRGR